MTLGEKIAKHRKESNYTQEQLASILGVSRQSISKWESNVAYPETEKLIRLGKLFDCSMDYLLNDDIEDKSAHTSPSADGSGNSSSSDKTDPISAISGFISKNILRERKSKRMVCGMPLYHIGRNAKGFFAVGLKAKGVFAFGLLAEGIASLGVLSIGIFSLGLLSLGMIAFGITAIGIFAGAAFAFGIIAAGAVSFGLLSFGAISIGCFSCGAIAIGHYAAIGDYARAMIALGRTDAVGSIYQYIGEPSSTDISYITNWLDSNVPLWLSWAKEIFKSIL